MGNSLFVTFTSIRLKMEGYSIKIIGITTAAYFAGLLLGSLRCNKIIERVGHIRAYAIFASLMAFFVTLQSMVSGAWMWMIVRFLSGFLIAGLFVTIESWLLSKSTIHTKGKIFSIYLISYYAAQGIGQLLLNVADPMSILPFAIIVMLSAISIVPVCISKNEAPIIKEASYINIFKLSKVVPLAIIGSLLAGAIAGPIYGLTPIFIKEIGFSLSEMSKAMSITIFGGLLLQWPIGQLSDIIDRKKVLFAVSFLTNLMCIAIILNSIYAFSPTTLLLAVLGGFSFTIYPLCLTHTTDKIDSKDIIASMAAMSLLYSIGAVIGPIVASYMMQYMGPHGLFVYMSLVCSILGFFGMYYVVKSKSEQKIELKSETTEAIPIKITDSEPIETMNNTENNQI